MFRALIQMRMVRALTSELSASVKNAGLAGGMSLPPQMMPEMWPELDRMVRGFAGRLHSRLPRGCGIEVSDLIQAGNVGLMQAAWNFEPGQGAPLAGFAKFRIRGEMLDMVRRYAGRDQTSRRVNTSEREFEGWESRIPAPPGSSPQEVLLRRQRSRIISEELIRLPARDRIVVRLRYSREMTLRQIGTALSVNESRACQIHQCALRKLKQALYSRGVRELSHL